MKGRMTMFDEAKYQRLLNRRIKRAEAQMTKALWLETRGRHDFRRGGKPFRSALRRVSWRRAH